MKQHESFFSTKGDHLVCKSTKFIYDLKQGFRNGILNFMKQCFHSGLLKIRSMYIRVDLREKSLFPYVVCG